MPRTKQIDQWLLAATLTAAAFGVVMVASASAPLAREYYHLPESEFAVRQLLAVILGAAAMLAAAFVPLEWLTGRKVALAALGATWVALLAVFLQDPVAGTYRWLQLPVFSIQPSAIAKVTLPLALASLFASQAEARTPESVALRINLGVVATTFLLVLIEPDLGSALLLLAAAACIFVLAGVSWRPLLLTGALLVPVVLLAVALKPYRIARLAAFFGDTPYQVHQSLIAIGRGGFIGQGPGESVQKLFYLPAPHNDFIFAIVGEELGFVGATLLLAVLGVVVVRGFVAAGRAASRAQGLLAAGLATTLAVQTLLNVSVCLNLLPAKGLPLPLVSAGGSDVLLTMVATGLLLNVAKEGT